MNEWVLALQIERYYTKNQIMELYANHIFLGANAYGVEAGAQTYFGKQAKDLTLEEAALLAAVPKAPTEYSPIVNPAKARERRDLVLDLMAKTGFATQAEVDAAKAKPVQSRRLGILSTAAGPLSRRSLSRRVHPAGSGRKYTRASPNRARRLLDNQRPPRRRKQRVVRAGLRWYDKVSPGWRSSYE